jgi:hypothetical protein
VTDHGKQDMMRTVTACLTAALAAAALAVTACGSPAPPPPPRLLATCGVTVVDAQTGISVVMWQPSGAGKAIYVRQVTADWYGTVVTVKADLDVPPGDVNVEVDQALPSSLYGNSMAKGCKVLSWR